MSDPRTDRHPSDEAPKTPQAPNKAEPAPHTGTRTPDTTHPVPETPKP